MRQENQDKIPASLRYPTIVAAVISAIGTIALWYADAKAASEFLWLAVGGVAAVAGFFFIRLWKSK